MENCPDELIELITVSVACNHDQCKTLWEVIGALRQTCHHLHAVLRRMHEDLRRLRGGKVPLNGILRPPKRVHLEIDVPWVPSPDNEWAALYKSNASEHVTVWAAGHALSNVHDLKDVRAPGDPDFNDWKRRFGLWLECVRRGDEYRYATAMININDPIRYIYDSDNWSPVTSDNGGEVEVVPAGLCVSGVYSAFWFDDSCVLLTVSPVDYNHPEKAFLHNMNHLVGYRGRKYRIPFQRHTWLAFGGGSKQARDVAVKWQLCYVSDDHPEPNDHVN